ncbi:hypothetical protein ACQKHB_23055 [Escherichia coli]|uniref:hypothetical protein n=1 Tax=Escherichia coli TaxID=562 RepID=UPI003CFF06D6
MKTQDRTNDLGCVLDKVREREMVSAWAAKVLRVSIIAMGLIAGFAMLSERDAIEIRVSEIFNPLPV